MQSSLAGRASSIIGTNCTIFDDAKRQRRVRQRVDRPADSDRLCQCGCLRKKPGCEIDHQVPLGINLAVPSGGHRPIHPEDSCPAAGLDLDGECEHIAHVPMKETLLATRIAPPTGTMRKEPRQARSRATTDAMLDAAARILGDRGWAGLTTNAVAETAGVSIGSLDQYFPNKLALIEAVRRRHFDEVLAVLRAAADDRRTRRQRVEALVDGMIAVHSRYPAAHRVLLEEKSARRGFARRTRPF